MGTHDTSDGAITTVQRAIAVLSVLAESSCDLGTTEIARRVGTNVSTVSRLLATLAEDEVVRRMPDTGRYRLGFRLVQLGNAALARVDLRELAHPHLVALNQSTGETATLSVPGQQAATTIDFVQSSSSVRSVAEIGRPSVPHATAVGKVFLAHGGHTGAGPLVRYTTRTITNRAELQREVKRVRTQGWAKACGEREDDLNVVAAPVHSVSGGLAAVLGVQGPAARFDSRAMGTAVDKLVDHAERLSRQLSTGG